jgi:AAA+ superfamily predicted ATPase
MRSTLLIELERFNGIAVFATNFAKNYDNAFVSRIRYHIEFKLPDLEGRKQLWNRLLVTGVPLEEDRTLIIERAAAASDGLSGREIRTVLRTAFPRALVENPAEPKVRWTHLGSAIEDVRTANRNVGKRHQERTTTNDNGSADAGRQLLGVGSSDL